MGKGNNPILAFYIHPDPTKKEGVGLKNLVKFIVHRHRLTKNWDLNIEL